MTPEAFQLILEERIPKPAEFVAFARAQGWTVKLKDGKTVMSGPKSCPLAAGFAALLRREPFRSKVLEYLGIQDRPTEAKGEAKNEDVERPVEKTPERTPAPEVSKGDGEAGGGIAENVVGSEVKSYPEATRSKVVALVRQRAIEANRKIFGFTRDKASCEELNPRRKLADNIDYLCVEGESEWTRIPREK